MCRSDQSTGPPAPGRLLRMAGMGDAVGKHRLWSLRLWLSPSHKVRLEGDTPSGRLTAPGENQDANDESSFNFLVLLFRALLSLRREQDSYEGVSGFPHLKMKTKESQRLLFPEAENETFVVPKSVCGSEKESDSISGSDGRNLLSS